MSQSSRRLTIAAAAAFAGLCAWLSQAAMAFTGAGTDRVALMPLSLHAGLVVAVVAAIVLRAGLAGASLVPVWLLWFLVLPWIPAPIPNAFALWSGPIVLLVWLAVGACLVADAWRTPAWPVKHHARWAGLLMLVVYSLAAWRVAPVLPGGDEPHYLIITQSLLYDHDLKIENNHLRGDYEAYFAGDLKPDYLRRGRDGEIYSIHAPGLPALVAPAFAIGGYKGVVSFLLLAAALAAALAWQLAWRLTGRADAAWFGCCATALSSTSIFHAFSVYPDGVAGLLLLTGVWAILRAEAEWHSGDAGTVWPWLGHGAALALLPWLHTRFAILAAGFGAVILLRLAGATRGVLKAAAFLCLPALSLGCWLAYFMSIYGTPMPTAPYGSELGSMAFVPDGLAGLLLDQRFGLLPYAPVLFASAAGFVAMLANGSPGPPRIPAARRLAVELLCIVVPYVALVTTYRMWWAGWSAPARFLTPILPLLALPVAAAWAAARRRATRMTMAAALVFTLFASTTLVVIQHGVLAFNVRTAPSRWLGWLARDVDLASGMPAWADRDPVFFRDIAVLMGAMLIAWAALRAVESASALRGRSVFATATVASYAVAVMISASLTWSLAGAGGTSMLRGQLDLLRRIGTEANAIAFGVYPWMRLDAETLPGTVRLRPDLVPVPEGSDGDGGTLSVLLGVPAGVYQLFPHVRGSGGELQIGIGDGPSVQSAKIGAAGAPVVVSLPVNVDALVVRGDRRAAISVRGVTMAPMSIVPRSARVSDDNARRAMRYGDALVYFLDDRSYPESGAFWVAGSDSSTVVMQFDRPRAAISFGVRNGPIPNRLSIVTERWRDTVQLQPGEERRVEVPADVKHGASRITFTTAAGFRPADVEPASHDARFLGVWLEIVG